MRIEFDYSTQLELNLVQICIETQQIRTYYVTNSKVSMLTKVQN